MIKLITLFSLLAFASSSMASTYLCLAQDGSEMKDAAFAFDASEMKLYQGSKADVLDSEESLEMIELSDVKHVFRLKCPDCFNVVGTLMGSARLNLYIKNEVGSFSLADMNGDAIIPETDLECSITEKEINSL